MRDSCGSSGTGETPQGQSAEEAHRTPHGKRESCSGNQPHTILLIDNKVKNKHHLSILATVFLK
ncbi:hypothetical protein CJ195_10290 [Bacillus sp. UMB0899]|nr:hypothetical protein CJ195_10290 [Bacillus sp. UMB0899]